MARLTNLLTARIEAGIGLKIYICVEEADPYKNISGALMNDQNC